MIFHPGKGAFLRMSSVYRASRGIGRFRIKIHDVFLFFIELVIDGISEGRGTFRSGLTGRISKRNRAVHRTDVALDQYPPRIQKIKVAEIAYPSTILLRAQRFRSTWFHIGKFLTW